MSSFSGRDEAEPLLAAKPAPRPNTALITWLVKPPGHDRKESHRDFLGINACVHSPWISHTLDALLILDLVILVVTLNLEVQFLKTKVDDFEDACLSTTCSQYSTEDDAEEVFETFGYQALEGVRKVLVLLSIIILVCFLLEHALLIAANGCEYFSHPIQVVDMLVVVVSLVFELAFEDRVSVGLLVLARTWRFIRIGHGIIDIEHHLKEGEEAKHEHG